MTDGAFVDAIALLAKNARGPYREKIGDYEFSSTSLVRLDTDPLRPEPLNFSTLAGFAEYVKEEPAAAEALIHVVTPTDVRATSRLGGRDGHVRRVYASATVAPATAGFRFGEYQPMGDLHLAFQTCFVQKAGDLAELRKFCAAVRSAAEKVSADDGVSQLVQAKAGVAVVTHVAVKNPWRLASWRTFTEVDQPLSDYVLRFDQGDDGPEAALFEIGDATWRQEAVAAVASYLRTIVGHRVLG